MGDSVPALRVAEFDTPFGVLTVVTDPSARGDQPAGEGTDDGPVVASGFATLTDVLESAGLSNYAVTRAELPGVAAAVAAYVNGDVAALDSVPVAFTGPPFRCEVWTAMRQVSAGKPVSYAVLAAAAGRPQAARAVGSACATNPVAPFVPCHRIMRADGTLGNYGYGQGTKAALLAHEGYQGT